MRIVGPSSMFKLDTYAMVRVQCVACPSVSGDLPSSLVELAAELYLHLQRIRADLSHLTCNSKASYYSTTMNRQGHGMLTRTRAHYDETLALDLTIAEP